jgi:F-type H+-transporting ATPase subunit gamma
MSVEFKEVRQRIGSVQQIRRVTSTLQRVAATRVPQQRKLIESSARYLQKLGEVLAAAAAGSAGKLHPLMRASSSGSRCVVLLGADRGLCGGFVASLINCMAGVAGEESVKVIAVGRISARRARRHGFQVVEQFRQPAMAPARDGSSPPWPPEIEKIRDLVVSGFLRGEYREVHIVYGRFVNLLRQDAAAELLLPLRVTHTAPDGLTAAVFEPSAEELLQRLVPEYIGQRIFDALAHSVGSENAARQMAMNRATDNAGAMLDDLVTSYRRLRQGSITTEMLELVGGNLEEEEEDSQCKDE